MSEQPLPAEARQFDFWIGDWDAVWEENARGTNVVRAVLDNAVILENFDGRPGTPLIGMSVSVYNAALGKWQQTWVDNQGGYLDFVGAFEEGRMVLQRPATRQGQTFLQRMVWYNVEHDQFDWNWERSDDDGQTWQVLWQIHYTRRAATSSTDS
ncbi:hypothetical protein TFLX_03539 [Thermoflexales bacterium]|nr:hypothetical protein TFLX_03539 [Thermoflexales bacterium]